MLGVRSPKIPNFLCLLHVQREIAVFTPQCQVAHLALVVCLIIGADETCHSHVISKLDEEVGAGAVVSSYGSAG